MTRRAERVASLLREALSEILLFDLNNPIFRNIISITNIKVREDLKRVTIFFRVYKEDPQKVKSALDSSLGYIKKLLGQKITLKFMPEIEFQIDTSEEEERRLIELFEKIKKEDVSSGN